MRAVWYDRQGPANEVLVAGELPTPEPGTGEVRVRLEASGVNPSDTYRHRGAVPAEYPRVITLVTGGAGAVRDLAAANPGKLEIQGLDMTDAGGADSFAKGTQSVFQSGR
jgi:NADPH:quinone reductase